MTAFAITLLICLIASNALWLRHLVSRERGWDSERGRLLNRILHPELTQHVDSVPVASDPVEDPAPILDEYDLVGTVQAGNANGPEF